VSVSLYEGAFDGYILVFGYDCIQFNVYIVDWLSKQNMITEGTEVFKTTKKTFGKLA
jgi:hypothetical protein